MTLHYLFVGHCVKLSGLFWTSVLYSVAALPRKVPQPKTNPPILHNDLQIDSARLLLSNCAMPKGQICKILTILQLQHIASVRVYHT